MIQFDWHITGLPQIERDSTRYNNESYLDGLWMRFYNKKPKKIGGYRFLQSGSSQIIRSLYEVSVSGGNDVYCGYSNALTVTFIDINGNSSAPRDRTPSPTYFTGNDNFTWKFSLVVYDRIQYILAIPIPNLTDIANNEPGTLYYGRTDDDSPLTPVLDESSEPIRAAGGVVTLGNTILVYDINGFIRWNNGIEITGPGTSGITVWPDTNSDHIGSENFIYAAPIRNGTVIGGLFWAVQGLIKATYAGPSSDTDNPQPTYDFSYVSYTCTILSSNSVVSYDPYFYWIGRDTFYVYNGVVAELPNQINRLFFFQNLNQTNAAKVFGFFNTQYQEVWWGWAKGLSGVTENNHALILNKEYSTWFDTANFNRSCGANTSSIFPYPILADSSSFVTNTYPLWQHEFGVDQVYSGNSYAIPSYVQTRYTENPSNVTYVADDIIFDSEQAGNMTVRVTKQGYPRSTTLTSSPVSFSPTDEHLTLREKGNLLSFIFESNTLGGDYLFGDTVVRIVGDEDERPGPVNE